MEAIQVEIHRIKNQVEDLKIKNALLKMEYNKVRDLNRKYVRLIKKINKEVSEFVEDDD